jgi:hypothetical protein
MAKFLLLLVILSTALEIGYVTALSRQTVVASCFIGSPGYRGNNLYDGYYYAELSTNCLSGIRDYSALGGLSHLYPLRISYNGRSIVARKGDVGCGGSSNQKIDLHITAARALFQDPYLSCKSFGIRTVTIETA